MDNNTNHMKLPLELDFDGKENPFVLQQAKKVFILDATARLEKIENHLRHFRYDAVNIHASVLHMSSLSIGANQFSNACVALIDALLEEPTHVRQWYKSLLTELEKLR